MSSRIVVPPSEIDFESRGRRDYWVALEHDSIWGEWHLPLTVIVGPSAESGKGLVAFGSTHGNEYEGPVAIKNLMREVDTADVIGRIIFIPVLNVAAFRSGARESVDDDGLNLNRAFVDRAGEEPGISGITHRIAKFVRDNIWPNVHVVLDIHSGGRVARYPPVILFHPVEDAEQGRLTIETARLFGTPFICLFQDRTPGLMLSESERRGNVTIGSELGWGQFVGVQTVKYARQGIIGAAIMHGQLAGEVSPADHHAAGDQKIIEAVDRECYVAAPWPGHYEPLVELGATVKKGQAVALLHDYHRIDEEPWPVRAGLDGYVLGQSVTAEVIPGQHILVIARDIRRGKYPGV